MSDSVTSHTVAAPTVPYTVHVPFRWSDMDAYGHVNNVQFLRILEDARVIAFREWFGQDRSLLAQGVLVTRHEIEYLRPMNFGYHPIAVEMWVTEVGGASFSLGYVVRDSADAVAPGQEPTRYAVAETGMVLYDLEQSRPRRMDEAEKEMVRTWAGPPVPFRRRR